MDDPSTSLLHALPDAVYVIDPATSRIVDCNRAAHEDLLLDRESVLAHSVLSLQTAIHGMPAWSEIAEAIRQNSPYRFIGAHRRADGSELPVEVMTTVATLDGKERFVSVARDIRRRPGMTEPHAVTTKRWQILHDLADGVWDWYPAEGRLVFSPRLHSLLGYGPEEMPEVIETWKNNVHPDDLPVVMTTLEDHLRGERHQFEAVYRLRNRNGHYLWVHDRGAVVEWDVDGQPRRVCGLVHDETDSKAVELRLQREADHDALTGLFNRRRGMELLDELFRRHPSENERRVAIVAIDLDRFKRINDRFGHLVGDRVLQRLGEIIRHDLPGGAIAMRWGGEEFLLGLAVTREDEPLALVERLRDTLADTSWGTPLENERITASAGLAIRDTPDQTLTDLIASADRSLYLAKRAGRDRAIRDRRSTGTTRALDHPPTEPSDATP
ncbi:MAG: diguanylate cyclase [Halothiobacillaceae bacterium]|nr:diguanylate cyclase [Halothiobacillaceae bacterium]HER34443.1 diguanylate cyclase [Halothiobacillaceae bacterium]